MNTGSGLTHFAFHIPPESDFSISRNPYSPFPGIRIHHFPDSAQNILATLSRDDVKRLILHRASGQNERRAQAVSLLILDTGLRIREVLGLTKAQVDFDNMLLKVKGKGNKFRQVPFSPECREVLLRASVGAK